MTPWQIPKMWEGGECWIIGGGPSMPLEFGIPEDVIEKVCSEELPINAYSPFLSAIHDKHVIGVNAAFFLGSWIDIMFFGDGGFYFANKDALKAFPKVKVSSNPNITKKNMYDIKYIPRNGKHPNGISPKENTISWNLNSGAASISLAYHLGVKRIYLLGFDMRVGATNVQHWHRHYPRNKKDPKQRDPNRLPFARHLRGFHAVANDANRIGLEIINISPNSKIEVFKRVKLSDVL